MENLNLNGGEITLLLFLFLNVTLGAYMHGKKKDGYHNFWVTLISSVLSFILYKLAGLF